MVEESSPPRVGDPAPPLDLPALDGGRVRVPGAGDQVVLLSFLRHAG